MQVKRTWLHLSGTIYEDVVEVYSIDSAVSGPLIVGPLEGLPFYSNGTGQYLGKVGVVARIIKAEELL